MQNFDEIFNRKLEEFRLMGYDFSTAFDKAEEAAKAETAELSDDANKR